MATGPDNEDSEETGVEMDVELIPTAHPEGRAEVDVEPPEGLLTTEDEFGDVRIPDVDEPAVAEECPRCGMPNPNGRALCRSCGERM